MAKHVARRSKPNRVNWGAVVKYGAKHAKTGYQVAKKTVSALSRATKRKSAPSRRNRSTKTTIASEIHSGIDKSSSSITLHKTHKLGKTQRGAGVWHYVQNHIGKSMAQPGTQSALVICCGSTYSQMITSTGPTYNQFQANTAYEQLNPNLSNVGSVLIPTQVTPLNDRFIIHDQLVTIDLTNTSGVQAFCELYLVTCRNANSTDPVSDWNAGYTDEAYSIAQYSQPVAGATGTGTTGKGFNGYPLSLPVEVPSWRTQWKVHHRHKFMMSGGASYQHNIMVKVNKLIKREEAAKSLGLYKIGTSWIVFIVNRGAVALDATNSTTLPTFAASNIAFVATVKTKLSAVAGQAARLPVAMYSNEVPYNTTLANLKVINEVDALTNQGTEFVN